MNIPILRTDENAAKETVVEAAIAFTDACSVYGHDGQFQVHTHNAQDQARRLWFAVENLRRIRHMKEDV